MTGTITIPGVIHYDITQANLVYLNLANGFPALNGNFTPFSYSIAMPSGFPIGQTQLHINVNCTVDCLGDTHLTIDQVLNGLL